MATAKKPASRPAPASPASGVSRPASRAAGRAAGKPVKAAPVRSTKASEPAAPPKAASTAAPPKSVKTPKPSKAEKPRKPKLVRDSFTIPKAEYTVIEDLKARAAKLGAPSKKSELLRAGIKALAAMGDSALVAALDAVPAIKTGRPAKT